MTGIIFAGQGPTAPLPPSPIPAGQIRSGSPDAGTQLLARTRDGLLQLDYWRTTAGEFDWHYGLDEVIVVIAGSAVLRHESFGVRTISAGDTVFFAAGATCHWTVADGLTKVAITKLAVPAPLILPFRIWNKLVYLAKGLIRASAAHKTPASRPAPIAPIVIGG